MMDEEMAKRKQTSKNALILYGSETGNSEDLAYELGTLVERLHFMTRISEMNALEINTLKNYTIVLLTVSTTGQGEFPRNALQFWKSLLRKSLSEDYLNHVSFTTFGLGDSSYPKFNVSARKLHKRLVQLGATEFFPAGEADDRHPEGIDGTYLSWSHELRKHLLDIFPLSDGLTPITSDVFLRPKYHLEIDLSLQNMCVNETDKTSNELPDPDSKILPFEIEARICNKVKTLELSRFDSQEPHGYQDLKKPHSPIDPLIDQMVLSPKEHIHVPNGYKVMLKENTRMTPYDHFQDVRELVFTTQDNIRYMPGDSIVVYPKNLPDVVERLIKLMNWQNMADKPLKFQPDHPDYFGDEWLASAAPHLYPICHSTLRQLLTHNLDITAIPRRRFFEVIVHFTENQTHRERLLEFANPLYSDEFYDYTSRPRRSILEVLEDFSSVQLPWQYVTSIFPVIRGRAYSIASGGTEKRIVTKTGTLTSITILVAIINYKTVLKKTRQGLCTRYLASLRKATTIEIQVEHSKNFYKLARNAPHLPLILVAPGTGIAPCRSLILERKELQFELEKSEKVEIGNHYLFYGGRNRRADFYYEQDCKHKDARTTIFTAFSRDQREKIYVQDLIKKETQLVVTLILRHGAIVYVCGSSGNMPKGVKEALISAFVNHDHNLIPHGISFTRETALQKLDQMVSTGNYVQETW